MMGIPNGGALDNNAKPDGSVSVAAIWASRPPMLWPTSTGEASSRTTAATSSA